VFSPAARNAVFAVVVFTNGVAVAGALLGRLVWIDDSAASAGSDAVGCSCACRKP
jgi:hypothetical protein